MRRPALIQTVLLSLWLGAAILTAGVVAPAAFRVLPTRTQAGLMVGEVLPVIFVSGLAIAILAAAVQLRGGAPRWRSLIPLLAVTVGCAVAQFVVGPRIDTVRQAISGPVEALDASDPRRIAFGRLHGLSVLWMGVAMVGAAVAVGVPLFTTGRSPSGEA